MSHYIYAIISGYIAIFFSVVSSMRNEHFGAAWALAIAVLIFGLTMLSLLDERRYFNRFQINCQVLWNKDMKGRR